MPAHPSRRDGAPEFDPKMFYRLNPRNAIKYTLSAGTYQDAQTNGLGSAITVTNINTTSSENWQIYYQSGRYFIRNYDWSPAWQLGLSDDDKNVPKMYYASGNISQQWSVNKVDGGYTLVNGLSGNVASLSPPSNGPTGGAIMGSNLGDQVWSISDNLSAEKAKESAPDWARGDWFRDVPNFQTPSPTPSASTSGSAIATSSSSSNAISSANPGLPRSSTVALTTTSPSTGLPGGAIAGIVIGSIALLAALVLMLWFFLVKKKKKASAQHAAPYEVHGNSPATEKYAHHSELPSPPAELAGKETETVDNRYEMDSSYAMEGGRTKMERRR